MTATLTKVCTKCLGTKPIAEFHRDSQKRDGRYPSCRSCESGRPYSPDRQREYYVANRERIRQRKMARHRADPSIAREQARASRGRRLAKVRATNAAYRAANRRKRSEQAAVYARAHPESRRAYEAARRARKRGLSPSDKKAHFEYVKWTRTARAVPCYWCRRQTKKGARHIDHIIALSAGGTDAPANLCVACPSCNIRKGAKSPAEFAGQSEIAFS